MTEERLFAVRVGMLALLLCACEPLATAQDKSRQQAEWEAKAVAQMPEDARRKYERLKNPTFAQLELLTGSVELSETPPVVFKPYKVGDKIFFRLLITNTSSEAVGISFADSYYYNRPKLLRDGSVMPYREGLPELLKSKESDIVHRSIRIETVLPQKTHTAKVEMERWYGSLQPGRYMLTVKRRFIWGGEWIESPSIMFEVMP